MVDFSRLLVANVKLAIVKIHLWKVLLVGYLILVVIQLHPVHHQQQRQQQQQPQPQPQPTSARNREATQRVVLRKSSLFHLQLFIALYALSAFRSRQQDFYDQYSSSYNDSHYWYGSGYGSSYGSNSNLYDYYGSTPVEIPQFQHPSHSLLQQNGFTQQVYLKYKQQCLDGKMK